jgi:serine/threonine-protein kinase RsbT
MEPNLVSEVTVVRSQTLPISRPEDIVLVRSGVRENAIAAGLGLIGQANIVTAASELARNAFDHGDGGSVRVEIVESIGRRGVRLTFEDAGPGIADLDQALEDGYSIAGGLGVGLGGARRLVDEFEISSAPGRGTTVVVTRWG